MSVEEGSSGGGADAGGMESGPEVGFSPDLGGETADMGQMKHEGELAGYFNGYVTGTFDIGPQEEPEVRESLAGLNDKHLQQLGWQQLDVYAEAVQDQNDIGQMVRIYASLSTDVPPGAEPPSSEIVTGWQERLETDAHINDAQLGRTEYIVGLMGGVAQERGIVLGKDGEGAGASQETEARAHVDTDVQDPVEVLEEIAKEFPWIKEFGLRLMAEEMDQENLRENIEKGLEEKLRRMSIEQLQGFLSKMHVLKMVLSLAKGVTGLVGGIKAQRGSEELLRAVDLAIGVAEKVLKEKKEKKDGGRDVTNS